MRWRCTSREVASSVCLSVCLSGCPSGQPFSPPYPSWRNRVMLKIQISKTIRASATRRTFFGALVVHKHYIFYANTPNFSKTPQVGGTSERLSSGAGYSFTPPLKARRRDSLELMIQLQQDPQEATLMKHVGITVSRSVIKSGNKQQAFDDLVTTFYLAGLQSFSTLPPVCLQSLLKEGRETKHLQFYKFSSHSCIVSGLLIRWCC